MCNGLRRIFSNNSLLEFVPGCCRSSLTPSSLVGLPLPLKAVGYDAAECRADGLSASQCIRGGFRFEELEGVFEADVIGKIKAFDTVRSDATPRAPPRD